MSHTVRKYIIAEDSQFILVNIINIIETQIGISEIEVFDTLTAFKKTLETSGIYCDILIMDLYFPDGNLLDLIPQIRKKNPDMMIIVSSSQPEIRTALTCLDYGANSYLCKGETFNSDLMVTLNSVLKQLYLKEKNAVLKKSIFDPANYPMVLFKVSEMGVEPTFRDFETFPELLKRPTEVFLMNFGISISMLLSDDTEYYEGAFILPAAGSRFFETILISFRMPDKWAIDQRLKIGFFQLCLFVQKSFVPLLPHSDKMSYLVDFIKAQVLDAGELNDEMLITLKSLILAELVKLV